jgi:hypothetical protein
VTIEPISEGGLRIQTQLPLAATAVLDPSAVPDTNGAAGKVMSAGDRDA